MSGKDDEKSPASSDDGEASRFLPDADPEMTHAEQYSKTEQEETEEHGGPET